MLLRQAERLLRPNLGEVALRREARRASLLYGRRILICMELLTRVVVN
jgi:hypothetical protein